MDMRTSQESVVWTMTLCSVLPLSQCSELWQVLNYTAIDELNALSRPNMLYHASKACLITFICWLWSE